MDIPASYQIHPSASACRLVGSAANLTISGLPIEVGAPSPGGNVDIRPTTSTNTALKLTGNFELLCGGDGTDTDCPTTITAQTGWVRIQASSTDSWTLSVGGVTMMTEGGHGDDANWTWHVGYYGSGGEGVIIQTDRTVTIDQSDNPWYDSNNVAHIFLGGHVDIADNWQPHRRPYSGAGMITLTCG